MGMLEHYRQERGGGGGGVLEHYKLERGERWKRRREDCEYM
jgi:hypothetical protein